MKTVYLSLSLPNYLAALQRVGAQCVNMPERADVLLLPGGGDLHPRLYGQGLAGSAGIDEARDTREIALVRTFAAQQKPVLGICRGLQVINVAFGGSLRQHIDGHSQLDGADRLHETRTSDPLLRALYGKCFPVNSAHHQATDRLGSGLRAVQWTLDGVVEAIRHDTLPIFAVQWHPERLRGGAVDGDLLLHLLLEDI